MSGPYARRRANWRRPGWRSVTPPTGASRRAGRPRTRRDDVLADLKLRGPHDLRHTFSTWLEDAGIPPRVIDELMGHAGGRRGGGEAGLGGSAVGLRYRWTTSEMEARVVAAIEKRLALAARVKP